jgi:hypothetical protein
MPGPGMAAMTTAESRNKKKFAAPSLQHDPEKWIPVFPRDKRGTRLRGDHAQTTTLDHDPIMI